MGGAAASSAGGRCATPGCSFHANTSDAYRNAKAPHLHKYCCEACSLSGGGAHGGFCQRRAFCQPAAPQPGVRTMYHGTSKENAERIHREGFRPSAGGMLGAGVYMSTDIDKARGYGPVVLEAQVQVGKVKRVDRQGHPAQKSWADDGYDSAWVPPNCGMVRSGRTENCIKDPAKIELSHRYHILGPI